MKSFLNFITESQNRYSENDRIPILNKLHMLNASVHINQPRDPWLSDKQLKDLLDFAEKRMDKSITETKDGSLKNRIMKESRIGPIFNRDGGKNRIKNIIEKGLNMVFSSKGPEFEKHFNNMFREEYNPYELSFNFLYNIKGVQDMYTLSRVEEFHHWIHTDEEGKKISEERKKLNQKFQPNDLTKCYAHINNQCVKRKRFNSVLVRIGILDRTAKDYQSRNIDASERRGKSRKWKNKESELVHDVDTITIVSALCRGRYFQHEKLALGDKSMNYNTMRGDKQSYHVKEE